MDYLDIPAGSLALGGRVRRARQRPLPLDQEAAAEAAGQANREPGLSDHIPSPLVPTDKRAAALIVGGAPAWSRRLRRIDTLTDQALAKLEAAWWRLADARRGEAARFATEWREQATRFDFSGVNELIRRHNEYFPAEANLGMDPRTGDYVGLGGGDYRRQSLDASWVLARFPTNLAAALAAPTSPSVSGYPLLGSLADAGRNWGRR